MTLVWEWRVFFSNFMTPQTQIHHFTRKYLYVCMGGRMYVFMRFFCSTQQDFDEIFGYHWVYVVEWSIFWFWCQSIARRLRYEDRELNFSKTKFWKPILIEPCKMNYYEVNGGGLKLSLANFWDHVRRFFAIYCDQFALWRYFHHYLLMIILWNTTIYIMQWRTFQIL